MERNARAVDAQDLPDFGTTEVVWCRRRSPAHAVVVSVFDELDKLHDSHIPTWQAVVEGATDDDVSDLDDIAGARGLGADNWPGMNVLCADCSHGDADTRHQHPRVQDDETLIGLAGGEPELRRCITEWQSARRHIQLLDLQPLWP